MKKYTDKETIALMDSVEFPKGLSILQTMRVGLWVIFNKKKFYKLCEKIEQGKALTFAYRDASQKKIIK